MTIVGNARGRRTRAGLLSAARQIIENDGFCALTMAAVAEHAGITRRAVYLHFASRAELVGALFDYVNDVEGLDASLATVSQAAGAVAALDAWAAHLARFHTRVIAVSRAQQAVRTEDPDAAAMWATVLADWMTWCRRLARALADEGRLTPPWNARTAADMLWVLMSFDVVEGLSVDRGWSRRQLQDGLSTLFRSTFVSQP